ncbi:hypothetical protein MMC12_005778 [Toensbergia leucococca]|nr:hypothetical protein [Toensbergia leucococca]
MTFTTSLLSGLTLTTLLLTLPLLSHRRTRHHQSLALHHSTLLLDTLDPTTPPSLTTRQRLQLETERSPDAPLYVLRRASWAETWKDRWNGEVEGAVRWAQGVRLGKVREGLEGRWGEWKGGERRV